MCGGYYEEEFEMSNAALEAAFDSAISQAVTEVDLIDGLTEEQREFLIDERVDEIVNKFLEEQA